MPPLNYLLPFLLRTTNRLPLRFARPSTVRTLSTTPTFTAKSSPSSSRWTTRQTNDPYAKAAKASAYKSRAAFKLLQIDDVYHIFAPRQIVIDLGYAPGSWTQVAVDFTKPDGYVLGVDIIPVRPPTGASTIQGNFLDAGVRHEVREWIRRVVAEEKEKKRKRVEEKRRRVEENGDNKFHIDVDAPGYIDMERRMSQVEDALKMEEKGKGETAEDKQEDPTRDVRHVDVILSDMCAPPEKIDTSLWGNCLARPHSRMCNTSGIPFRDHAGSMDLCNAALRFSMETLKPGGTFVCKFFDGKETKILKKRLDLVFEKVFPVKPDASRKESKEAYFVGLRRKKIIPDWATLEEIE